MLERFTDLSKLSTFPEEVQHEITEYEGMGRELVSIEHNWDEGKFDRWEIIYYHPLIAGEESPFDEFWMATIRWYSWPTSDEMELSKHFYSIDRTTLQTMHNFRSKQKPAIEEVA